MQKYHACLRNFQAGQRFEYNYIREVNYKSNGLSRPSTDDEDANMELYWLP